MSTTTFSGPVRSLAGFIIGDGATATAIAANATVGDDQNGKLTPVGVATGATITLPASSGSGATFRFLVTTSVTSNSYKIQVANATDVMVGSIAVSGTTTATFGAASTSDTITMNGTTQGGLLGTYIELTDYASGFWRVSGTSVGSGSVITPFSAAV
jgi:hypothetical protein